MLYGGELSPEERRIARWIPVVMFPPFGVFLYYILGDEGDTTLTKLQLLGLGLLIYVPSVCGVFWDDLRRWRRR
jgi:hypothetical protein